MKTLLIPLIALLTSSSAFAAIKSSQNPGTGTDDSYSQVQKISPTTSKLEKSAAREDRDDATMIDNRTTRVMRDEKNVKRMSATETAIESQDDYSKESSSRY